MLREPAVCHGGARLQGRRQRELPFHGFAGDREFARLPSQLSQGHGEFVLPNAFARRLHLGGQSRTLSTQLLMFEQKGLRKFTCPDDPTLRHLLEALLFAGGLVFRQPSEIGEVTTASRRIVRQVPRGPERGGCGSYQAGRRAGSTSQRRLVQGYERRVAAVLSRARTGLRWM